METAFIRMMTWLMAISTAGMALVAILLRVRWNFDGRHTSSDAWLTAAPEGYWHAVAFVIGFLVFVCLAMVTLEIAVVRWANLTSNESTTTTKK